MLKKLLIAVVLLLLVIAIALWMAPARLASNALETNPDLNARLLGARGTLWDGSGQLLINATPIGTLRWQVQGMRLLGLEAAVDWQLAGDEFEASGTAAARDSRFDLRDVNATVNERLLRNLLGTYDIAPTGTLSVIDLDITDLEMNAERTWPAQVTAAGQVRWTGGPVRYRLSGQSFDIELPPMLGEISTKQSGVDPGWPQLLVTNAAAGEAAAPLITGRLTPRGSAAIGITQGFTRLAGQPWPGSEPDHIVVLEVEEQLN